MSATRRRRALVTGASRGIGAAVAEELASRGCAVIVHYRAREDDARALAQRLRAGGAEIELARFDVTDAEATAAGLAAVVRDDDPIDIVVNNAGVVADAPFPALERDAWERVVRTSLDGFYNVTRPLVMPMVHQRWGRIVNVSSVSAIMGNRGQTNYAAAKAGLIGATKSLARELAKRNITVNAVAPGLVETEMLEGAPLEQAMPLIPMRRLGRPQEVAKLIGFLASDDAAYITGQVIGINGGMA
jgi:3-oxoacyl-[acyl-carrier protein] reductase